MSQYIQHIEIKEKVIQLQRKIEDIDFILHFDNFIITDKFQKLTAKHEYLEAIIR